jgi:hypothetical protein
MKIHTIFSRPALALFVSICAQVGPALLGPPCVFGQQTLFTTQEDFVFWTGADPDPPGDPEFTIGIQSTPDFDGSATNGLGNNASPGDPGTAGSMNVTWQAGTYTFFYAPDVHTNQGFLNALGKRGRIIFENTQPPAGTGNYFQLGIVFNYDGHFDQFFPPAGGTVDLGDGRFQSSIPYAYTPSAISNYFQFGMIYNSNFNTMTPFTVDNIRVIKSPPGDYNADLVVNAADYVVWRNSAGSTGVDLVADDTGPGLDGIPDGVVDEHDYNLWRANFGNTAPALGSTVAIASSVPEPATLWLTVAMAACGCAWLVRRNRS